MRVQYVIEINCLAGNSTDMSGKQTRKPKEINCQVMHLFVRVNGKWRRSNSMLLVGATKRSRVVCCLC